MEYQAALDRAVKVASQLSTASPLVSDNRVVEVEKLVILQETLNKISQAETSRLYPILGPSITDIVRNLTNIQQYLTGQLNDSTVDSPVFSILASNLIAQIKEFVAARRSHPDMREGTVGDDVPGKAEMRGPSKKILDVQAHEATDATSSNSAKELQNVATSESSKKKRQEVLLSSSGLANYFKPCASAPSFFLYAQGPHIVCCHHGTLAIERVFSRHHEDIILLAVDNESEEGAGRVAVSYDTGRKAIVWDITTGEVLARFAPSEDLTVAVWMKNANLIVGRVDGNLMLFEPSTPDRLLIKTFLRSPITALAPSSDCKTVAIGYQTGTLVIASMVPRFTPLHNLTRGPSQILCLAWHGSSSKQRSDMLAVQDQHGVGRVWSIPKARPDGENNEAKVVRTLQDSSTSSAGPKWTGWSKNGRIVRYTTSGIAVYGRGGALFTLGRDNTVQQFDLLREPPTMVANIEHPGVSVLSRINNQQISIRSTTSPFQNSRKLDNPVSPAGVFVESVQQVLPKPQSRSNVSLGEVKSPDDLISCDDLVSIKGIEGSIPRLHWCSKGQNCHKWKEQILLMVNAQLNAPGLENPLRLLKELEATREKPIFMLRKSTVDSSMVHNPNAPGSQTEPVSAEKESVVSLCPSNNDSDDASTAPSGPFWSDGPGSTKATSTSHEAVSRLASQSIENEKAESLAFYNYASSEGGSEPVEENDIASLGSVHEDIASLIENTTATPESREAAANFLVKKLTDDNELLSLYQEAVRRMGEARFVRNHRRLLKRFFLDLRSEEQSPIERAAVRFLRLRSERSRISSNIHRSVRPLEEQTREQINMKIGQEKDNLFLLDRLLGEQDATTGTVTDTPPVEPIIYDDEDVISEASEGGDINADDYIMKDKLPNLESVSEFLTTGKPFASYKANLKKFLHPDSAVPVLNQGTLMVTILNMEDSGSTLSQQPPAEKDIYTISENKPCLRPKKEKTPFNLFAMPAWLRVYLYAKWATVRKLLRPQLKPGYRRIEWRCDCGVELYADFVDNDSKSLDNLERSLQQPIDDEYGTSSKREHAPNGQIPGGVGSRETISTGDSPTNGSIKSDSRSSTSEVSTSSSTTLSQSQNESSKSKFLALCVNTGGIYKTLSEIDITGTKSDRDGFQKLKQKYLGTGGFRSKFSFLIRPVTLEFVQFTLWSLRGGYVSICNRPESIPPHTACDYEYMPKPLHPLPPMPPEVFIHYLEHGDEDLHPSRYVWLPRLPMRLNSRVIDGVEPGYGWGIHVIEGPNREVIFWIIMTTICASVLASVLWSSIQSDIQGGAGLGAIIVALPSVILTAFLFRLGGI